MKLNLRAGIKGGFIYSFFIRSGDSPPVSFSSRITGLTTLGSIEIRTLQRDASIQPTLGNDTTPFVACRSPNAKLSPNCIDYLVEKVRPALTSVPPIYSSLAQPAVAECSCREATILFLTRTCISQPISSLGSWQQLSDCNIIRPQLNLALHTILISGQKREKGLALAGGIVYRNQTAPSAQPRPMSCFLDARLVIATLAYMNRIGFQSGGVRNV
ncbi:hypothetical protein B0T14DRAFT_327895 [Immersiella caudata]|uniref:Uncharacterized protein n=1 Tax=Immersiella caudata TaxID=314043 RepID=A0AA39WB31_9PEZI|nr:hypothetical protein B0T14DRAFT_327895 [Immersiella caudata]